MRLLAFQGPLAYWGKRLTCLQSAEVGADAYSMPPLPSGRRLLAVQRSSRLLGVDGGKFFVEAPKGLKMRCWHLPFNIFAWQPEYPARNARNVSILLTSASYAQVGAYSERPPRFAYPPCAYLPSGPRKEAPVAYPPLHPVAG